LGRGVLAVVIALSLVFLSGGGPALGATITVSTTIDELNSDGDCSLREAIRAANTNAQVDACVSGGPAMDTINVPPGSFLISIVGNEDWAVSGDFDLTQYTQAPPSVTTSGPVTIEGAGATSTFIDGDAKDRVFDVRSNASGTTFKKLTIQDGATSASGGGINVGNPTSVTLDNVVIATNYAALSGGGINNASVLNVTSSTIRDNTAGYGAGIANAPSTGNLTLTGSTVSGNVALGTGGAGIDNRYVATITNSTISGNQAVGSGSVGGGILYGNIGSSSLALNNVTIANNSALGSGGGIRRAANGPNPTVTNTIVSGNTPANCSGALTSNGRNLDSGTSCGFGAAGDIQNGNANLNVLENYGGPTKTQEILAGSQAIDGGSGCPATDQRGIARVGVCDIGAFEYQGGPTPTPTPAPTPTPTPAPTPTPTPTPAPLDTDGDGIPDATDPDDDNDGFSDGVEVATGTNPIDRCADTTTTNDEADDKWPPDFDDNRAVNVVDFSFWNAEYPSPPKPLNARADLNASGSVNVLDFGVWKTYFGTTCLP
jgi:CSLREA domain-containing protein